MARPVVRPWSPPGSPADRVKASYATGSKVLMVVAVLLLASHLGRIFEKLLVGLHLPIIITGVAIVFAVLGQGVLRVLQARLSMALGLFLIWMMTCAPFSSWKSGSARYVVSYVAVYVPLFLILAAAPRSVSDLRKLFCIAGLCCLLYVPTSGSNYIGSADRLVSRGTFGNPGDLAQLMAFGLPFWIFLSFQFKNVLFRTLLLLAGGSFILITLGRTATRSGIVALACMGGICFLRSAPMKRIFLLVGGVCAFTVFFLVLPHSSVQRLETITQALDSDDDDGPGGPDASVMERRDLMKDAIRMTVTHPIFGVGPGQFGQYRFNNYKRPNGKPKHWFPAHNTYLQISSELGIPGLILYVVLLGIIYKLIRRSLSLSSGQSLPSAGQFRWMGLCLESSLVAFAITAAFLNCDRYPYLFILGGLALALERMVNFESAVKKSSGTAEPAIAVNPGIAVNPALVRRAW